MPFGLGSVLSLPRRTPRVGAFIHAFRVGVDARYTGNCRRHHHAFGISAPQTRQRGRKEPRYESQGRAEARRQQERHGEAEQRGAASPPPPEQEVAKARASARSRATGGGRATEARARSDSKENRGAPAAAGARSRSDARRKKLLEQKLEEERKAEEEASKKAEEGAKKQAEDEAKKKAEEDERKKKKAKSRKKKAGGSEEESRGGKKKFDPSKIASLLEKAPDDAPPKALPTRTRGRKGSRLGSNASAQSRTSRQGSGNRDRLGHSALGPRTGSPKGLLKSQLNGCWRPPGTGGGSEVPVVELHWETESGRHHRGRAPRDDGTFDHRRPRYTEAAALRAVRMCAPFTGCRRTNTKVAGRRSIGRSTRAKCCNRQKVASFRREAKPNFQSIELSRVHMRHHS